MEEHTNTLSFILQFLQRLQFTTDQQQQTLAHIQQVLQLSPQHVASQSCVYLWLSSSSLNFVDLLLDPAFGEGMGLSSTLASSSSSSDPIASDFSDLEWGIALGRLYRDLGIRFDKPGIVGQDPLQNQPLSIFLVMSTIKREQVSRWAPLHCICTGHPHGHTCDRPKSEEIFDKYRYFEASLVNSLKTLVPWMSWPCQRLPLHFYIEERDDDEERYTPTHRWTLESRRSHNLCRWYTDGQK